MSKPKRWLDDPTQTSPLERDVLGASSQFEPPGPMQDEIWRALGLRLGLPPDGSSPPDGSGPPDAPTPSNAPPATSTPPPAGASASAGPSAAGSAAKGSATASAAAKGSVTAGAAKGAAAVATAKGVALSFGLGKPLAIVASTLALAAGGYGLREGLKPASPIATVPASPPAVSSAPLSLASGTKREAPAAASEPTAATTPQVEAPAPAPEGPAAAAPEPPAPSPPAPRTPPAATPPPAPNAPVAAAARPAPDPTRKPPPADGAPSAREAHAPVAGGPKAAAAATNEAAPAAATTGSAPTAAGARKPAANDTSLLHGEGVALLRAQSAIRGGDAAGGLRLIEEARAKNPSSALGQEWEALAIEALWRSGQKERAADRGRAFLRAYPTSVHAERVRTFTRP